MSKNVREKVEGAVEAAAGMAEETKDKLKETSGETTERARMLAEDAAHRAGEWARGAGERAQELGHEAREATDGAIASVGKGMSNLAGSVREHAPAEGMLGSAATTVAGQLEASGKYLQQHGVGEMADDLTRMVRKNPVPSLLVAFGVGFLAGSLLRRSS
jgi:ElaB/YqjD/DUF883 family membrane-anchored ribosome-binding protein